MQVYSYGSRSDLVVGMNQDLTYYHEAALVFTEPSYFSGPMSWASAPDGGQALRILSSAERSALPDDHPREIEGFLFEIRTDEDASVFVGAADLTLKQGAVYYYPERISRPKSPSRTG